MTLRGKTTRARRPEIRQSAAILAVARRVREGLRAGHSCED